MLQARFELAPDAQCLFPFTWEGSDDLRQWHRMGAEDQLVRLRRGDQTVERLAVEIDQVRVLCLRLRASPRLCDSLQYARQALTLYPATVGEGREVGLSQRRTPLANASMRGTGKPLSHF